MLKDCSELVRRSRGRNAEVAPSHRRNTTLPQQRILVGLLKKIARAIQLKINVLKGFGVHACDDCSVWYWGHHWRFPPSGLAHWLVHARRSLMIALACGKSRLLRHRHFDIRLPLNQPRCRYAAAGPRRPNLRWTFSNEFLQSQKSFRTKQKLAKAQKQNRPIPQWIRLRTNNTIRYADPASARSLQLPPAPHDDNCGTNDT